MSWMGRSGLCSGYVSLSHQSRVACAKRIIRPSFLYSIFRVLCIGSHAPSGQVIGPCFLFWTRKFALFSKYIQFCANNTVNREESPS